MKKINFKPSGDQGKIISYNRGYIYHRIYLALRAVIRNHLRQKNPDPPLKLIKRVREIRNWTPNPNVRRIFKKNLNESVAFEDNNNNNNKIKLKNLG